jgi:hypothetical protein
MSCEEGHNKGRKEERWGTCTKLVHRPHNTMTIMNHKSHTYSKGLMTRGSLNRKEGCKGRKKGRISRSQGKEGYPRNV